MALRGRRTLCHCSMLHRCGLGFLGILVCFSLVQKGGEPNLTMSPMSLSYTLLDFCHHAWYVQQYEKLIIGSLILVHFHQILVLVIINEYSIKSKKFLTSPPHSHCFSHLSCHTRDSPHRFATSFFKCE